MFTIHISILLHISVTTFFMPAEKITKKVRCNSKSFICNRFQSLCSQTAKFLLCIYREFPQTARTLSVDTHKSRQSFSLSEKETTCCAGLVDGKRQRYTDSHRIVHSPQCQLLWARPLSVVCDLIPDKVFVFRFPRRHHDFMGKSGIYNIIRKTIQLLSAAVGNIKIKELIRHIAQY